MKKKNPKIKYSVLSNSYEDGRLKGVDVSAKMINLQCSWIKRLFDENFHESKIIPAYLIKTNFGKNFKFCQCYEPSIRSLKNVPTYHKIKPTIYKEMTKNWAKYLSYFSYLLSAILSQLLWFNSKIKIDKKSIFISGSARKNINFVAQIFHGNGKTKSWNYTKSGYILERKLKYHWIQLTDTLPKFWEDRVLNWRGYSVNLCIFNYHLTKILTLLKQIGK